MSKCLVYALVDPRNLLVRYVGASRSGMNRPKQHRWPSSIAKAYHVSCWVRSLHAQGLTYDIVVLETTDSDNLYSKEQWWIAYGRALGWDLTNLTNGGEGPVGWVPSAETRERISKALTGKRLSAETRAKMSASHKGRPKNPEANAKLALYRTGRKHSIGARLKMSTSAKARGPRVQGPGELLRRSMPKTAPFVRINLLPQD